MIDLIDLIDFLDSLIPFDDCFSALIDLIGLIDWIGVIDSLDSMKVGQSLCDWMDRFGVIDGYVDCVIVLICHACHAEGLTTHTELYLSLLWITGFWVMQLRLKNYAATHIICAVVVIIFICILAIAYNFIVLLHAAP